MENNYIKTAEEVIDFIYKSPTAFHAISNIKSELENNGYTGLSESEAWSVKRGGKYYVTRNMSSVIAFEIPENGLAGFMMIASHSDSPCFKIKPDPEMTVCGEYLKLNVEKYGGMICSTWFDRPLSIAGRILLDTEDGVEAKLVNFDKNTAVIPNLAIHMNRSVNDGYSYNIQKDMLPLISAGGSKDTFKKLLSTAADGKRILGSDLFLYNREKGTIIGADDEFFSAPRIDNLECAYLSLKALLGSSPTKAVKLCCVFDNEEVGSGTKQGAKSTFLNDTLKRIAESLGMTHSEFLSAAASSFMLSADNGHAVHPNYEEKACPTNKPILNGGVLIKYNAQQKYTTDAMSEAVFKKICDTANIPYQVYVNRSDILGGSTLGNLSSEQISVNTVDIGLAQLAMHSCYETAGVKDVTYMKAAMQKFYETELKLTADGTFKISM